MKNKQVTIKNFSDAYAFLGDKKSKALQNNTWLVKLDDGSIGVRLHNTFVVTYYPDGVVELNTGRWWTVTTRDRMNVYSGHRISFRNIEDTVDDCYEYKDGIKFQGQKCLNGSYIIRAALLELLNKDVKNSTEAVEKCIGELSIDEMSLLWKKCSRDHRLLANFCSKEYLLLILNDKDVNKIIQERLSVV